MKKARPYEKGGKYGKGGEGGVQAEFQKYWQSAANLGDDSAWWEEEADDGMASGPGGFDP